MGMRQRAAAGDPGGYEYNGGHLSVTVDIETG
jgi:hypothetical protein